MLAAYTQLFVWRFRNLRYQQHRGVHPVPVNASCNALIQPMHPPVSNPLDIVEVAVAVRNCLIALRDETFVAANTVAMAQRYAEYAEKKLSLDLTPVKGLMFVNSTRR
jgi:hypothetical protein